MKEQTVVNEVERQLNSKSIYYNNNHGSIYSKNGTPDFVTLSNTGQYLGIECKVDGKELPINQIRRAIEILNSGGRYVVATSDFDLDKIFERDIPLKLILKAENEFSEDLYTYKYKNTTELILER